MGMKLQGSASTLHLVGDDDEEESHEQGDQPLCFVTDQETHAEHEHTHEAARGVEPLLADERLVTSIDLGDRVGRLPGNE
jgi:hypothetical protein